MKKISLCILALFAMIVTCRGQVPEKVTFARGAGQCVYAAYEPLKDKPITLYYYIPTRGDIALMPVLFAMHGTKRHGNDARDAWRELAERYGFIVLSPEYSKKLFSTNEYNYGNVSKSTTEFTPQPHALWTYNTIETIFDFFRDATGNLSDKYDIWGHSAGGQFVQRFLLCMPEARVNRAVAANAGTWTFLATDGVRDRDGKVYGWPFSIKETPFAEKENLKKFFARNFFVNIGTADINTTTSDFPNYPAAMAQGATRYARGENFYKNALEEAKMLKCRINWQKSEVRECGHSSKMMIYGKYEMQNGKKVYHTDYFTHTGAFWLIYGDRVLDKK